MHKKAFDRLQCHVRIKIQHKLGLHLKRASVRHSQLRSCLVMKDWMLSPKIRSKSHKSVLATCIRHCTRGSSQGSWVLEECYMNEQNQVLSPCFMDLETEENGRMGLSKAAQVGCSPRPQTSMAASRALGPCVFVRMTCLPFSSWKR